MAGKFDLAQLPPAPDLQFECELWQRGIARVAGIDEAGRGPLAGPVSASAVILPPDPALTNILHGVRDSKQMTAEQREFWAVRLKEIAVSFGIGFASSKEIDSMGILPATRLAIERALACLYPHPDHLLLDYIELPACAYPQTALVKGDARSLSIAAASILAKTARDALLRELDAFYPGYGFSRHKGYGTASHLEALERLGPCEIHRRSFRPIKKGGGERG